MAIELEFGKGVLQSMKVAKDKNFTGIVSTIYSGQYIDLKMDPMNLNNNFQSILIKSGFFIFYENEVFNAHKSTTNSPKVEWHYNLLPYS